MTRPEETSATTAVPTRVRWSVVLVVALAAVLLGVLAGAWWHAGTLHLTLGLVVGAGTALLAAVTCVVVLVGAFRRRDDPASSGTLAGGAPVAARRPVASVALRLWAASTIAFGAIVASLLAGLAFQDAYLTSAKAWCEAQVPAVEAFKERNGRYPRTVQEIRPDLSVPWVVETFDPLLHVHDSGVVFDLNTAYLSGWSFDSAGRAWSRYN